MPALRRRGVEEATGEFVAIIEEHCSAKADWLQQALRAHATGDFGAVGGPIADFDYPRLRDWVVYFLEYNSALPPVPSGETADLNDANIVYPTALAARPPRSARRGLLADDAAPDASCQRDQAPVGSRNDRLSPWPV